MYKTLKKWFKGNVEMVTENKVATQPVFQNKPLTTRDLINKGYTEMLEDFNESALNNENKFIPEHLNTAHQFAKMSKKLSKLSDVYNCLVEIDEEDKDIVRYAMDSLALESFVLCFKNSVTTNIVAEVYYAPTLKDVTYDSVYNFLKEAIKRHTCPIY